MSDLLAKWLRHYDPIHRGCTRAGIASGVTATGGWSFPGRSGGFLLYLGSTYAGIDMTRPAGAASARATSIGLFTWIHLAAATTYYARLVAIGPGGVESVENAKDPQVVKFRVDADGDSHVPVPPAPRDLEALPMPGGAFRLRWRCVPSKHFATASSFRVYGDGGGGSIDYVNAVATITARRTANGAGYYAWDSDTFEHGTRVQFAVRAATTGGGEEANTIIVSAQADAQGPADHQVSRIVYGDDE